MGINLNNAPEQKVMGDIIPSGTIAPAIISFRKRFPLKEKEGEMMDLEFTISQGPFEKRKIWENMMIAGDGSDGHNQALDITMSRVRAIIESGLNIEPSDDSKDAMSKRDIEDWEDIDGFNVLVKIGIEKSKDAQYSDKNKILAFITPDMDEYEGFEPEAPPKRSKGKAPAKKPAGKTPAKAGEKKPDWA